MERVRKPSKNENVKTEGGRKEVERSGKQSMRLRNTRAVPRGLLWALKGFLTPYRQRC